MAQDKFLTMPTEQRNGNIKKKKIVQDAILEPKSGGEKDKLVE